MKAGDSYRNFVIRSYREIPEIESVLLEAEHKPTGASIMMIIHDDDENVFNISFRTCPESSNGVAHVLEHMALCGSTNYPVRDPFFSMTRRSLNTFMNAFTGSDFTCYPAASQIPEDFYNLLSMYIDAAFHPLLSENAFLQEGWRLELEDGKLIFNGVVFNEMKGALMSGEARLSEALNASLFPSVTYGVNSGGDPREIPSLTLDFIRGFHESNYTLGRCLFYFYGNIKPSAHLDFLEEKLLRDVKKVDKTTVSMPLQKRFKEPVRQILSYPADPGQKDKVLFGLSWLTCSILEQQELLAINVLDLVLMGTDAAPLKSCLLKSGFCKQADLIVDNEIREIPVTLVCKGCSPEGARELEGLIFSTLEEIANTGLAENLVEGAIHQLELSRKEITGYSLPYGLSLFFRAGLLKQHGGDPADALKIHSLFSTLREKVKDPTYLPGLIRKHFLNNMHFSRIIMVPDPELNAKENDEERRRLEEIDSKLTEEDREQIKRTSLQLEEYRSAEEDVDAILPGITLDKIPQNGKEYALTLVESDIGKVYHHECFTNDMVFVDVVTDLPPLSAEELPWLRLLSFLMPQLGCGGRSYKEHLEFLLENTGGVDVSYDWSPQAKNPAFLKPSISFRGKALATKASQLFSVFSDLEMSVDFSDTERIGELLMQHEEALTNSIRNNPMGYAVGEACSALSVPSGISYLTSGLPYVRKICGLVNLFKENPEEVVTNLKALYAKCFQGDRVLLISCNKSLFEILQKENFFGLSLKSLSKPLQRWEAPKMALEAQSKAYEIPVRAAFNVLAFPLGEFHYEDPDSAALLVAAEILDNVILHTKIREQGGAYGSGASVNLLRGVFYCYSYRDPEISITKKAFYEALEAVAKGDFKDKDVNEGILGVVQDIDSVIPPGGRASAAYFRLRSGRDPEVRQKFRKNLLGVSKEQVVSAFSRWLSSQKERAVFVTFSGREMLNENADVLEGLSVSSPIA
ncbi:insulinase family protein [Chlamydiifrater phoenicopteri]|uniref:insulinase family protein n=1 Tax=Chlamydiifrater phoenicopteri TaxID=2681469 RepID=UPI001BCF74C5|nr:insulinase family protein [Chlamydiifrater phoenicopteri]